MSGSGIRMTRKTRAFDSGVDLRVLEEGYGAFFGHVMEI